MRQGGGGCGSSQQDDDLTFWDDWMKSLYNIYTNIHVTSFKRINSSLVPRLTQKELSYIAVVRVKMLFFCMNAAKHFVVYLCASMDCCHVRFFYFS